MRKDEINAAAYEIFSQVGDGFAVPVDPELAEAMGAFQENALTADDIIADRAHEPEEDDDGIW